MLKRWICYILFNYGFMNASHKVSPSYYYELLGECLSYSPLTGIIAGLRGDTESDYSGKHGERYTKHDSTKE